METKIAKLSSTISADEALDRMIKATNEGFNAGRVTKTELLSWIVDYFETHSFERSIEKIRRSYFDDVAYLKGVVKDLEIARREGKDTKDITTLLAPLMNGKAPAGKKQGAIFTVLSNAKSEEEA